MRLIGYWPSDDLLSAKYCGSGLSVPRSLQVGFHDAALPPLQMFFHQHHRHSAQILPLETMPENEHESAFDEALRQAMQIGVELKNEIERLENHSPQLILFEGTLLFYLEALLLLSSLPNESKRSSGDFVDILRQCGSKRRNARLVAQQTPDSWAGGFPQLTLALQGYSHTIICFVFIKIVYQRAAASGPDTQHNGYILFDHTFVESLQWHVEPGSGPSGFRKCNPGPPKERRECGRHMWDLFGFNGDRQNAL